MNVSASTSPAARRIKPRPTPSWRAVAVPVEHGGWSFLIEPLVLGLIVAPSAAGAWVALSAVAAFLARHPLRLAALDWRKGVRHPRTALAERVLAGYAAAAAASLAAAVGQGHASLLLPLAFAAPLALFALRRDLETRSREALSEMAGALALGSSAATIILAGYGDPVLAWTAWALGAGRAITTILYVRARVRVDRGTTGEARVALTRPVHAAHAAAVVLAMLALGAGLVGPAAASAFALLLLRAAHGLAPGRKPIRPQILGVQEVLIGVVCVGLFAAGLD